MNTLENEISEAFELMATNDFTAAQKLEIAKAALRFEKSRKTFLSRLLSADKIAAVAGVAAAVFLALHLARNGNASSCGGAETSALNAFAAAEYGETSLCIAGEEYVVRREARHKWTNEIEAFIASGEVEEFFRADGEDYRLSNEDRKQ